MEMITNNILFFNPNCSANKLSEIIHHAKETKKQNQYTKKYNSILKKYGIADKDIKNHSFDYESFYTKLVHLNMNESFIQEIYDLNQNFLSLKLANLSAQQLRMQFDNARKDYLIPSMVIKNNQKASENNAMPVFLGYGTLEEIFTQYVDKLIKDSHDLGKNIYMYYEDLNGDKKSMNVSYQNESIEYSKETETIESRPNGHWIGESTHDAFRVNYYWDVKNEKWVPVVLTLISHFEFEMNRKNGMIFRETFPFDDDESENEF